MAKRKTPRRSKTSLAGLPAHHENLAHRYAARATSNACSSKGLQALLSAQTAYVHAKESGNAALLKRLEKKRDLMMERATACCFGG
jgi:hypothetical protein